MYIQRKLLLMVAALSMVLPAERLVLKVLMPAIPAIASAFAEDAGGHGDSGYYDSGDDYGLSDHDASGGVRAGGDDHGSGDDGASSQDVAHDNGGDEDRGQRTQVGDDNGVQPTRDQRFELGYDRRTAAASPPVRSSEERRSIFDWFGDGGD